VDKTQAEIVKALRAVGASVVNLSRLGGGCPDLLVGYAGRTYLLEVKSERAYRADGTLGLSDRLAVEGQEKFRMDWRGDAVVVVRSVEDALAAIGAWKP
jgi:Holliday junction resolvase